MFRLAASSVLAIIVLVCVIQQTWPRPQHQFAVEGESRSDLVDATYAYKTPFYIPENTTQHWMQWIVYRSGRTRNSSKAPTHYQFINTETGYDSGRWDPEPAKPKNGFAHERFDYKGRILIEEGPVKTFGVIDTQIIHRVDPATLHHERLPVPSGDSLIGYQVSDDGSKMVRFHGGQDKPLRIDLVSMEDRALINSTKFPNRLGFVESWPAQVAFANYAISVDGTMIAISESWQQKTRMTPLGVEIWNLENGELIRQFNIVKGAERPEIVEDDKQPEFPVESAFQGHCRLAFRKICGQLYVTSSTAIRRKYQAGNAWQMDGFKNFCLNMNTGELCPFEEFQHKTAFAHFDPLLERSAIDGSRLLWLSEFPRWNLKKARLTDASFQAVTDWYTFPVELCGTESDNLHGMLFPDSKLLSLTPYSTETSLPGSQGEWWNWVPEPFNWTAPEIKPSQGFGYGRAVLFDFKSEHFQVYRRTEKEGLCLGSTIAQRDKISLLIKKPFRFADKETVQPRIEVWKVPIVRPKFNLAALLSVLTFAVSWCGSTVVYSRKSKD